MPRASYVGSLLLFLIATTTPALAQTGGLFSGRNPTNPNPGNLGNSSSLTGTGVSNLLTNPLGGLTGSSTGGFGATGTSAMGGSGAMGGATGMSGIATLSPTAQSGFVGRGNTGFVGNRLAGQQGTATGRTTGGMTQSQFGTRGLTQNQFGARNTFGQSQFGTSQRGGNGFNAGGFNGGFNGGLNGMNGMTSTANIPLHVRQRLAFAPPSPPTAQVATRLRSSFERMAPRRPAFRGVNLEMETPGTVVLTGVVPSVEAAKLAETIVRLEPGVNQVRNELQVATP